MGVVKRIIWTLGYRPFVMGGRCNYVLAAELPCTGPFDLGKGFSRYMTIAPNGSTFIVDAESLALIGSSLEDGRADVAAGAVDVMRKQVAEAIEKAKEAEVHPAEIFWEALKVGR
jgi:hypothetical protein